MNVELVNPMLVLRLLSHSDAAKRRPDRRRAPAWAQEVQARLDEKLRYGRALHGLHRLDDGELDHLDLARADVPAPAWRHVKGFEPQAQS